MKNLLGILFATSCLTACADGNDGGPFTPPDERGPYPAGHLRDTIAADHDIELPVWVWYPAASGREAGHPYDELGISTGRVVVDAAAACEVARPVVLFSHGNAGLAYQTYSLVEHLARHGYIVVAPAHVHNTTFDMDEELKNFLCMRRPLDIVAAYDWIGGRLPDCVDPTAGYVVMGHSFGGYTTLAVAGAPLHMQALEERCEGDTGSGCTLVREWIAENPGQDDLDRSDSRVWAAVPMAPASHEIFGDNLARIDVPILVIGGDRDLSTPWEEDVLPTYAGLTTTPRFLCCLEDTGHFSFTDFCEVLGEQADGCGTGYRDVDLVLATLRTTVLAFLMVVQGEDRARDWLPPDAGVAIWESGGD